MVPGFPLLELCSFLFLFRIGGALYICTLNLNQNPEQGTSKSGNRCFPGLRTYGVLKKGYARLLKWLKKAILIQVNYEAQKKCNRKITKLQVFCTDYSKNHGLCIYCTYLARSFRIAKPHIQS